MGSAFCYIKTQKYERSVFFVKSRQQAKKLQYEREWCKMKRNAKTLTVALLTLIMVLVSSTFSANVFAADTSALEKMLWTRKLTRMFKVI